MASNQSTASKVIYEGIFASPSAIESALEMCGESQQLAKTIANPHVTLAYMPDSTHETIMGEEVSIRLVGYGCDQQNAGFLAEVKSHNSDIRELCDARENLHITTSIADGAQARDTVNLDFEPITPIMIRGVCGAFDTSQQVSVESDLLPKRAIRITSSPTPVRHDLDAEELAKRISDYMHDWDPYEYADNFDYEEEAIGQALRMLQEDKGGLSDLIRGLADDSYDDLAETGHILADDIDRLEM